MACSRLRMLLKEGLLWGFGLQHSEEREFTVMSVSHYISLLILSFWFVIFLFYFDVFTSCLCLFPPFFCAHLCQSCVFKPNSVSSSLLILFSSYISCVCSPVLLCCCFLEFCSLWLYGLFTIFILLYILFLILLLSLLLPAFGFCTLSSWIKAHLCLFVAKLWPKLSMYMNCNNALVCIFTWFCVSATKKSFFLKQLTYV